ncbi:MAG: hypothetical protein RR703_02215 [Bacilli bacterium]
MCNGKDGSVNFIKKGECSDTEVLISNHCKDYGDWLNDGFSCMINKTDSKKYPFYLVKFPGYNVNGRGKWGIHREGEEEGKMVLWSTYGKANRNTETYAIDKDTGQDIYYVYGIKAFYRGKTAGGTIVGIAPDGKSNESYNIKPDNINGQDYIKKYKEFLKVQKVSTNNIKVEWEIDKTNKQVLDLHQTENECQTGMEILSNGELGDKCKKLFYNDGNSSKTVRDFLLDYTLDGTYNNNNLPYSPELKTIGTIGGEGIKAASDYSNLEQEDYYYYTLWRLKFSYTKQETPPPKPPEPIWTCQCYPNIVYGPEPKCDSLSLTTNYKIKCQKQNGIANALPDFYDLYQNKQSLFLGNSECEKFADFKRCKLEYEYHVEQKQLEEKVVDEKCRNDYNRVKADITESFKSDVNKPINDVNITLDKYKSISGEDNVSLNLSCKDTICSPKANCMDKNGNIKIPNSDCASGERKLDPGLIFAPPGGTNIIKAEATINEQKIEWNETSPSNPSCPFENNLDPGNPDPGNPDPDDSKPDFIWRTISLDAPFIKKNGQVRDSSWEQGDIDKVITARKDIYNEDHLMYKIELSPSKIQDIREYNKNHNYKYDDKFKGNISSFLRDEGIDILDKSCKCYEKEKVVDGEKFNSNKCGTDK